MQENRIRLRVHVVLVVVDVEQSLEGHEVVNEAIFLEVVQAEHVVQPVVEQLAEQLEFLRPLILLLVVAHFLDRLWRAVEVDTDAPVDGAIGGDGLEQELVRDFPFGRRGDTPAVVLGETHAVGVRRVDVASLGVREVPVNPGCRREERITVRSANVPGTTEGRAARAAEFRSVVGARTAESPLAGVHVRREERRKSECGG